MLKYLLLLLPLVSAKYFDNYSLYKIYPENARHVKILEDLQHDLRFNFWKYPSEASEYVNIMSSPETKGDLENLLNETKMKFEITLPNIQAAIDNEKVAKYTRDNTISMKWDSYYTNEDINTWMADQVAAHPDVATLLVIGQSVEGRDITGIKISHGEGRRAIFIEGGLHAREWISPAVSCYMIDQLLNSDDEATKAAAREHDWYIVPVTNPDGYAWSHVSPANRMWRKNRRPLPNGIYGVDLNRNWNNNWLVVGASTNPLSDAYAGPGPFSEPETRSLSQFLRSIRDKLDIYLAMHSYGQMLLIPFGNTTDHLANYDEALNVGRRSMGALAVRHNTPYVVGNVVEVLGAATGAGDDWVKDHLQVPLVYCFELRDRGQFGFLLPPEQIYDSCTESWDGILDLIFQARRFGVIENSDVNSSSSLHLSSIVLVMSALFSLINW